MQEKAPAAKPKGTGCKKRRNGAVCGLDLERREPSASGARGLGRELTKEEKAQVRLRSGLAGFLLYLKLIKNYRLFRIRPGLYKRKDLQKA